MVELKLPPNGSAILAQHSDFPRAGSKLLVYALPGTANHTDIEELCQTSTEFFLANEGEGDDPAITFLTPAPASRFSPGQTVQEILDAHLESLTIPPASKDEDNNITSHPESNPSPKPSSIFPFAFIVVEDPHFRTNGVTVVFCHDDDDFIDKEDIPVDGNFWRVDECEVSLQALVGVCRDLVLDREEWTTIEVCVGRPTRRTGNQRYLAERDDGWHPESISGSMPVWGL